MLAFACVSALATRKKLLVSMAKHMSVQRPLLSERCLANLASELALSSMSLTHMQGIGAARLELRPTVAAGVSTLITVHAHMSRQIRLIFSSVPTKTATEHICRLIFHVACIASFKILIIGRALSRARDFAGSGSQRSLAHYRATRIAQPDQALHCSALTIGSRPYTP